MRNGNSSAGCPLTSLTIVWAEPHRQHHIAVGHVFSVNQVIFRALSHSSPATNTTRYTLQLKVITQTISPPYKVHSSGPNVLTAVQQGCMINGQPELNWTSEITSNLFLRNYSICVKWGIIWNWTRVTAHSHCPQGQRTWYSQVAIVVILTCVDLAVTTVSGKRQTDRNWRILNICCSQE